MATMALAQYRDAIARAADERPSRHVAFERRGEWQITRSGVRFYALDPRPDEVRVSDIAHGLARRDRWNCTTERFYSVGEHSMRVGRLAKYFAAQDRLPAALVRLTEIYGGLHDANEVYLVDLPRPIKRHIEEWADIEAAVQRAIHSAFGLPSAMPSEIAICVERADNMLLLIESRDPVLFSPEALAELLYKVEIPDAVTTPEIEEESAPPEVFFDVDWKAHRTYLENLFKSWMEQGQHAQQVAVALEDVEKRAGSDAKAYMTELVNDEARKVSDRDFEPPAHLRDLLRDGP
jgi:hypothetical protein